MRSLQQFIVRFEQSRHFTYLFGRLVHTVIVVGIADISDKTRPNYCLSAALCRQKVTKSQ